LEHQIGRTTTDTKPTKRPDRNPRATVRTPRKKKEENENEEVRICHRHRQWTGRRGPGLRRPAQAGVDHNSWLDQIGPSVSVPQVDTSVHQSR